MKNFQLLNLLNADFYLGYPKRKEHLKLFKQSCKELKLLDEYDQCCICEWCISTIDLAHVVPHNKGGYYTFDNIVPLCPNHHRQFENSDMAKHEYEMIRNFLIKIKNKTNPYDKQIA